MAHRNTLLHLISWCFSSQAGPADHGVFMVTCTSASNSQAPSQLPPLALCPLLLEGSSFATFGQL